MDRSNARQVAWVIAGAALLASTGVQAQNFVTSDQPQGGVAMGQPLEVEHIYAPAPAPVPLAPAQPVYSVPVYEAYEPTGYNDSGYRAATQAAPQPLGPVYAAPTYETSAYPTAIDVPAAPLDLAPSPQYVPTAPIEQPRTLARPYGQPVDVTPPQATVSVDPADIGFRAETDTSRQLLALDDAHAARLSGMERAHRERRRALLDRFAKDAEDPAKVIGLADRMRAALKAVDEAHDAMVAEQEASHRRATLRILDAAPSRIQ